MRQRPAKISDIGKPNVPKHSNPEHYGTGFTLDEMPSFSGTGTLRAPAAATSLGPFSGCMRTSDPAPEGKVSARLRSPPHIPTPADAIATRSHLLCSLCLLAMPFVVFPPPSHKLHLGSPRGGDGTRPLGSGRIGGLGLACRAPLAQGKPRVHQYVALIGNQDRAGPPGLSLVTIKTIPTYRTRGPRREAAPTPPPGRWLACTIRGWQQIRSLF